MTLDLFAPEPVEAKIAIVWPTWVTAADLAARSASGLVSLYLIASYAYYHLDETIMADSHYDAMCVRLDAEWDAIQHPHKGLIDRDGLGATTGYAIPKDSYPLIVQHIAVRMARAMHH